MEETFDYTRGESKPIFHLIDTYRLRAHSKGDDDRATEEINKYELKDPLNIILKENHKSIELKNILKKVDKEVEEAISESLESDYGQIRLNKSESKMLNWERISFNGEKCFESIKNGFETILSNHQKVILLGEDIESPYGGAFKCTLGLSEKFPDKVRNTPISEAAILGIGNGLALGGFYPIVEFMFGDFIALAADQWINHAAKFNQMYNGAIDVPVIIRTPMGGKRGYGPTHSQSLEKHFLGVPGTQVLCLHNRFLPSELYGNLIKSIDKPTLVVENKVLYSKNISSDILPGYELFKSEELFPTINLRPVLDADFTIVALGGASIDAENAILELFEEYEIIIDLFIPTMLYPFNIDVLSDSLTKTKNLITIEEGQGFSALGSEIIAQIVKRFYGLNIYCDRIFSQEISIPSSKILEENCLPNKTHIINKVRAIYEQQ